MFVFEEGRADQSKGGLSKLSLIHRSLICPDSTRMLEFVAISLSQLCECVDVIRMGQLCNLK